MGHVCSKGLRIQWERVRQSLLRTDPSGVHQRRRESIRRRVYRVSGPLALWHIDGNHKLIRCNSYFKFNTPTVTTVGPPLTATFLFLSWWMVESMHSLLFERLYNGHLSMIASNT